MVVPVDVVVVGGGPAGAATALSLSRAGHPTALIERSGYQAARIGETLPPAIRNLLVDLGVWERFVGDRHVASPGIQSVWGRADLYEYNTLFNPYGTGWHVARSRFDAMLAGAAEAAGARVAREAQLRSCVQDTGGGWEVEIECRREPCILRAKVLVDATGRTAALARAQGAKKIAHDRLIGIVGFCSPFSGEAVNDCTLVEAVDEGWWYSALLPDSRLVVAYMTDADLTPKGVRRSPDYWRKQMRKAVHTSTRADAYRLESGLHIAAAASSRLDRCAGRNWLAVGDAAAAWDPLSSQGVYRALESGIRAVRSIGSHLAGDDGALWEYARVVQSEFETYLLTRARYYNREQRWPDSLFWQRRHCVPAAPLSRLFAGREKDFCSSPASAERGGGP